MKPPEEELRSLVAQWVRKADEDFRALEHLAEEADKFRGVITFHAQQAVEKYIKALLTLHGIDFPKTHDIRRLLDLLRPVDPQVAQQLREAQWLTPFGAAIRYPGDFPELRPGDEERAIELARRVRTAVGRILEG
jgi:HEPN domain-containing protein